MHPSVHQVMACTDVFAYAADSFFDALVLECCSGENAFFFIEFIFGVNFTKVIVVLGFVCPCVLLIPELAPCYRLLLLR